MSDDEVSNFHQAMQDAINRAIGNMSRVSGPPVVVEFCGVPLTQASIVIPDDGVISPVLTAEQRAAQAAERHAAALERGRRARAILDAVTDPVARVVLDLHSPQVTYGWAECQGCEYTGFEGEPADWPCTTVEVVLKAVGSEPIPDGHLEFG